MKTYWIGHILHALKYEFCQQHLVRLVQLISLGKYHWNDEACTFFSCTAKSLHNEPIWIFPLPHTWNTLGTEKGRWEWRGGVPWVVCLGDNLINNWLQTSEIHSMSKANCSLIPELEETSTSLLLWKYFCIFICMNMILLTISYELI